MGKAISLTSSTLGRVLQKTFLVRCEFVCRVEVLTSWIWTLGVRRASTGCRVESKRWQLALAVRKYLCQRACALVLSSRSWKEDWSQWWLCQVNMGNEFFPLFSFDNRAVSNCVLKLCWQEIRARSQGPAYRVRVWAMESSWICARGCWMFGGWRLSVTTGGP